MALLPRDLVLLEEGLWDLRLGVGLALHSRVKVLLLRVLLLQSGARPLNHSGLRLRHRSHWPIVPGSRSSSLSRLLLILLVAAGPLMRLVVGCLLSGSVRLLQVVDVL